MSRLRTRTQPCDGRPGIGPGWSVPWMPITPPPGQSVSTSEYPAVPIARVPYSELPLTSNFSRIQKDDRGSRGASVDLLDDERAHHERVDGAVIRVAARTGGLDGTRCARLD